jgi:hypothetical protein
MLKFCECHSTRPKFLSVNPIVHYDGEESSYGKEEEEDDNLDDNNVFSESDLEKAPPGLCHSKGGEGGGGAESTAEGVAVKFLKDRNPSISILLG